MSNLEINLCGFVGGKPVLKKNADDTQFWVRFSVAANPNYRNSKGEWVTGNPVWFTCKAWGEMAVHISRSISKGERVLIQGRLAPTTWESTDRESGQTVRHRDVAIHINHIGVDLARHETQTLSYTKQKETQENDYGMQNIDKGEEELILAGDWAKNKTPESIDIGEDTQAAF